MEKLSKANSELIDLNDVELCAALLEHWGISCHIKTVKKHQYTYVFLSRIGNEQFRGVANSRQRIIEIINDHTDPETGVLIL